MMAILITTQNKLIFKCTLMKNYKILLASILFILNAFISKAQQNDTLDIQRNDKGIVNFVHFKPNADRKMQNDMLLLKSILKAKNEDGFINISELTDEMGIVHKKFQQFYKGIKVENAEYLVHGKNGIIETINGDFQQVKNVSVSPSINEQQALGEALNLVNAKKYKWEDEAFEKFIKQRVNKPLATYYPKGELVIAKDYLKGGKNYRLAWKFTISSLIPDNEQWIYIDAVSGEVIGNTPLILDVNTSGTAQTKYNSQNLGIICDSYPAGFRLSETRNTTTGHSVNIHTWNCLNGSDYTSAVEFSNTSTNWVTGSWAAIVQDQAALDAHWGEEKILYYWSTVRQRNSLNNQGLDIIGYVHYNDPNSSAGWPNNAQWDPTGSAMRYGDGDGITLNPLTSLDVVAHEMGHGINQFTANLHSSTGDQESDALNEGFSDIWGATIEQWAAPSKQAWLMGEEIFKTTTYNCIRNLQNPKSTTAREGQHPDTYHGSYWSYSREPHANSTVLSHWFYLLSQGGTGTNDIGNSFIVYGLGIDVAQRIAYQAESARLNSSADYAAARTATTQAANDLFGANSFQGLQVANAWYAVGVGSNPGQPTVSGADLVCYSGSTFTANNPPSGSTISWDVTQNLLEVTSGGSTATPSIRAKSSSTAGLGKVVAKFTSNGVTTAGPSKDVNAGGPIISGISGPTSTPNNQWATYHAILETSLSAPTGYNWILNPLNGNSVYNYGSTCDIAFYNSGSYQLVVQAKNACTGSGYGPYYVTGIYVYNSYRLSISPNPTTTEATIELVNTSTEKAEKETEWDLEVYDAMQSMKAKVQKIKGNNQTLSTSGWKEGVYIVRAIIGKDIITGKLLVKP